VSGNRVRVLDERVFFTGEMFYSTENQPNSTDQLSTTRLFSESFLTEDFNLNLRRLHFLTQLKKMGKPRVLYPGLHFWVLSIGLVILVTTRLCIV